MPQGSSFEPRLPQHILLPSDLVRLRRRRSRRALAIAAAVMLPASGAMGYTAVEQTTIEPLAVEALVDFARPATEEAYRKGEKATGVYKATSADDVEKASEVASELGAEPEPIAEAQPEPEPETAAGGRAIAGGEASYYGARFAGRRTANGEIFDPSQMTAAHRTLPFGSRVRVTHRRNGRSVIVRINDRGPFHRARVIDLSRAAASSIGMISAGRAQVDLELLD